VTTVFLVRHGETAGNRERRIQPYETPLSARGRAQARLVAERLSGEGPFDALYTSDLRRARQTASAIGRSLRLRPISDARLRELDMGDWKGYLHDEIGLHFPCSRDEWVADGGLERLPGAGGESTTDVVARVSAAFEAIVAGHAGQRVILVSHGWALMLLLAALLNERHADVFREQRRRLENTSVTVFEAGAAGEYVCSLLNCTRHLDGAAGQPGAGAWGADGGGAA